MNKKIQTEAVDHLFEAILSLENKEECYGFFEARLMNFSLSPSVTRWHPC